MYEACPKCGGEAQQMIYYAPDVGRHWLKCKECGHEWV